MEEKFIELDVSKIKQVPSDTEIPVHNNPILTKRPLCTNFPENATILDKTEAIKIITDISEDLSNSPESCIQNIPQYIEELQAVFTPVSTKECNSDLFEDREYTVIDNTEDLLKYLSELLIRFDTNPKNYTKEDYLYLLTTLYKSLLFIYKNHPLSIITTLWLTPSSDERVPSEKLVKETIDVESERIEGLISNETSARQSADSDLLDNIDSEAGTRASEITRVEGLISNIDDLIPSEATSSNQLADKEFVHDLIATNASNFRGDWANWASVPSDPLYYPEDYTGNKKPNNNDYLIIQNATDYSSEYTGIWRFIYKGNWDTLGKSGWESQYRVELAFTPELLNAINSGITSLKVSNYDNYRLEIDDLFPLIAAGL